MYRRILVPLDGTDRAKLILPHAVEIARRFGATLVLLRVLTGRTEVLQHAVESGGMGAPTPIELADAIGQAERDAAAEYFARVQGGLREAQIPHALVLAEGDTVEALAAAVRDQRIDLVAMTTHARSTLGRLIFGDTVDAVLQHIDVPVLLLRIEK